MLKEFWNSIKKSLLGFLILLGVWTLFSLAYESYIVPSPLQVISSFTSLFYEKALGYHYSLTLYRLFLGFLVSFFLGSLIGILSFILKINNYIENIMSLLQVIPGVIVGSFFILFYGLGSSVPIGMIIVMITPIVATNTVNGLLDHTKELVEVINVFGGGYFDIIKHVYFPKLLPVFKTNFLVCTALSLKIIILGEYVGCQNGIGFLFNNARVFYNMNEVFSYLLLIILTALSFQIFIQAIFLFYWRKIN